MIKQGIFFLFFLCIALWTTLASAQYKKMNAALELSLQSLSEQQVLGINETDKEQTFFDVFLNLQPESSLSIEKLEQLGCSNIIQLTPSRLVVSAPIDGIAQLTALDEVKFIEQTSASNLLNDRTRARTKAEDVIQGRSIPTPLTGKNVLLGVIDRGFDFNHLAFQDAQGNTRVKCVMIPKSLVQNFDSQLYEDLQPFLDETGYAFVIDDPSYIARLTTDDSSLSHGTHVAGTAAASNCLDEIPYGGMAPDADIVLAICPTASNSNAILAFMCKLLADYAERKAKPMVVNISLGENGGPHDGTDAIPSILSEMSDGGERPGLVFVVAAGNEGKIPLGLETEMPTDGIRTFLAPERLNESNYIYWLNPLEIWSENSTPINFRYFYYDVNSREDVLTSPVFSYDDFLASGYYSQVSYMNDAWEQSGFSQEDFLARGIVVNLIWGISANNGRFYINFNFSGSMDASHALGIELEGPTGLKTYIYASGKNDLTDYGIPGFSTGTYSAGYNAYCCSDAVISVGASVERTNVTNLLGISTEYSDGAVGDLADFSSWGTSPNGIQIPLVVAPGSFVISPFNYYHDYNSNTNKCSNATTLCVETEHHNQLWGHLSGTSMAAPAVVGIIAEWLQANPTLTSKQIQEVIRYTSSLTETMDERRCGNGVIDALNGLQYVLDHFCGIRNIQADDDSLSNLFLCNEIFTIDGRKVSTGVPVHNALLQLPLGVYIVDGRKVVK